MKSQLQVKDSDLEYSGEDGRVFWSLPIPSIALIAEYTTNEGPLFDDYFLVFITIEDMFYFHTASFYAASRDETLAALKKLLGSTFELKLIGSTEWDSHAMWPQEIAGNKYFQFKPVRPETMLQKVKEKLLGPTREYSLAKPIQEYLQSRLKDIRNSK
ncbi:MAG: hypothetical protein LAO76_09905 [Acidobacteriia bacterium]|nr:hypothetical protein [Terriglobia bacterium]